MPLPLVSLSVSLSLGHGTVPVPVTAVPTSTRHLGDGDPSLHSGSHWARGARGVPLALTLALQPECQ